MYAITRRFTANLLLLKDNVCLKCSFYRSRVKFTNLVTDAKGLSTDAQNYSNKQNKSTRQRPTGGGRYLHDPSRVFEHNNWDNVVWDDEQEEEARTKVEKNSKIFVSSELQEKYEDEADHFWDEFYNQHQNRFFKDRHWLFTEFPELAPMGVPEHIPEKAEPDVDATNTAEGTKKEADPKVELVSACSQCDENDRKEESYPGENATYRLFEVGCGVGNTVFPVLQTNNDPGAFMYCCDLSSTAIQLVKDHPDYSRGRCHAFVCDVSAETPQLPFPSDSLDVIIFIFVLSAVHPDKMQRTIAQLSRCLKPGGLIVFRDYGRYDLAQLRFKEGRCLSDNFYVRGDGTRVYFFTQEELRSMLTAAGLEEVQNLIDRRLQVNRGRQLKMYRVWIQCKYRKPLNR